ncbi:MAG TPA: hypothetical protein VHB27_05105 [Rhodopila sp.]|uniref:hypothetical protein n=1 Tax=Rhodopila sp. TaxID=2480087 RepID=UPI002C94E15B|nr:hypothetical protein [Rhodopila sp.]HVY14582.1 hypothetical protein [Rhodopila sp.]
MTLRTVSAFLVACLALGPLRGSISAPSPNLPRAPVIWAWERPEDLRFADPDITVAVLAGFVRLTADSVQARPRLQPARLSPTQPVIGVVHVEIARPRKPAWTAEQRARTAALVLSLLQNPRFRAWQIDFEVRASERHILLDLLGDVRERMPPGKRLSMTALASWCDTETWLEAAPVDDIVPMLFRMGPSGIRLRARLAAGGDWRNPRCRTAIGVASDTPPDALPPDRQVWMFNPHPWTAADLMALRNRLRT